MTPAPRGADLAVTVENRSYAALTDGASVDGASVSVKPGGQVTWFAVPDGGDPRTMAGLVTPVTSGRVAHRVGAKSATTTLTWSGPSGPARLFVAMPHQVAGLPEGVACDLGTFPSVHGTLRVCRGGEKYPLFGRTLALLRTTKSAEAGAPASQTQVEAMRREARRH